MACLFPTIVADRSNSIRPATPLLISARPRTRCLTTFGLAENFPPRLANAYQLGFIDYGQPDNSSVLGRFAIPEHSVLGMTANKGITFDLEAIRRANPGATSGVSAPGRQRRGLQGGRPGVQGRRVGLCDGQVRLRALSITESNSSFDPLSINIPIGDKDRFLTLVVSDGGDQINNDRVIFGDPRLEVTVCPPAESTTSEAANK